MARVVMGSAAVQHPELVDAAAEVVDVAVGLDHRDGEVAVHGWTRAPECRWTRLSVGTRRQARS